MPSVWSSVVLVQPEPSLVVPVWDRKRRNSNCFPTDFRRSRYAQVAEFLSEKSGLRFILDQQNLDEGAADAPITLKLGELELGAVLQALEDVKSPICFIVRDYGILVTTHESQPLNSVTARDFWKLTEDELREKLRLRRFQMNMGGGGMGGMGGGMGGQGGMGGGFY